MLTSSCSSSTGSSSGDPSRCTRMPVPRRIRPMHTADQSRPRS
ncbi:hypothetical protein O974_24745 [Mycobacterium avium 11-0986]|nr:hypothetical protein O974_24745 [Mycobacterium avium 11-0986]